MVLTDGVDISSVLQVDWGEIVGKYWNIVHSIGGGAVQIGNEPIGDDRLENVTQAVDVPNFVFVIGLRIRREF